MTWHKYNAKRVTMGGHSFDSKKEAGRYMTLQLLVSAGKITNLELQPRFELQEGFTYDGHRERKIEYVADFRYTDADGNTVVEDVKGVRTDVYKLKRKLFLKRYGDSVIFREI